jgi:hypothetical protein
MHIVEIHQDGTEEQLPMGMELETQAAQPSPSIAPIDIEETPSTSSSHPQPIVKLLQCKPLPSLPSTPMPTSKLMLWVDGCLAPALPTPLVIDLSAASAAMNNARAANPPVGGVGTACGGGASSSSTTTTATSAAVKSATERVVEELGGEGQLNDAAMGMFDEDLRTEGLELPLPSPRGGPNGGRSSASAEVSTPHHRAASAELTPPVSITGRLVGSGGKRTRPSSACATSTSHQGGFGGGGGGASSSSPGDLRGGAGGRILFSAGGSADGLASASGMGYGLRGGRGAAGLRSSLSSDSVAEEPDEQQRAHAQQQALFSGSGSRVGSLLGLSDVLGDMECWQLESPSKRPTLDTSRNDTSRNGLSPPAIASLCNLSVRSAGGSPMRAPMHLLGNLHTSAAAHPTAAPTRPPTACCASAAARCCAPEPSLATPISAAAAAADVSAAAAAAAAASVASSQGSAPGVSAASTAAQQPPPAQPATAAALTAARPAPLQHQPQMQPQPHPSQQQQQQGPIEEPPAPPPSPIVGPRPEPFQNVPWLTKRKQREQDLELPSSLLHVESELDALRIEPQPKRIRHEANGVF